MRSEASMLIETHVLESTCESHLTIISRWSSVFDHRGFSPCYVNLWWRSFALVICLLRLVFNHLTPIWICWQESKRYLKRWFFAWQHNIFQLDHYYIIKVKCKGQQSFDQFDQSATTANYFQGDTKVTKAPFMSGLCVPICCWWKIRSIVLQFWLDYPSLFLPETYIYHKIQDSCSQYEVFTVYFGFISVSFHFALIFTCIFH